MTPGFKQAAAWRTPAALRAILARAGKPLPSSRWDALREARRALGMDPALPRLDARPFAGAAKFHDIQDWGPGLPRMEYWNLLRGIGRHPKDSTVDSETLRRLMGGGPIKGAGLRSHNVIANSGLDCFNSLCKTATYQDRQNIMNSAKPISTIRAGEAVQSGAKAAVRRWQAKQAALAADDPAERLKKALQMALIGGTFGGLGSYAAHKDNPNETDPAGKAIGSGIAFGGAAGGGALLGQLLGDILSTKQASMEKEALAQAGKWMGTKVLPWVGGKLRPILSSSPNTARILAGRGFSGRLSDATIGRRVLGRFGKGTGIAAPSFLLGGVHGAGAATDRAKQVADQSLAEVQWQLANMPFMQRAGIGLSLLMNPQNNAVQQGISRFRTNLMQ